MKYVHKVLFTLSVLIILWISIDAAVQVDWEEISSWLYQHGKPILFAISVAYILISMEERLSTDVRLPIYDTIKTLARLKDIEEKRER